VSYITVEPDIVIRCCQRYVDRRQQRIAKERENLIAANSKPTWRGRVPSRESVIESLKKSQIGWTSEWDRPEEIGSSRYLKVLELSQLASAAALVKTTVALDSQDLDLIVDDFLAVVSGVES
jgi:hypothetical protein